MPKLSDIIEIAESLQTEHVLVVPQRCAAVRHRKSTCRLCVEACIAGAVSLGYNKIAVDPGLCVGCGACTTVCPTEALVSLSPTDDELEQRARAACAAADGTAVIACARMASKRLADPAKYAEVPCLSRVDEGLLVQLAADGAQRIVLVDGVCRTCKHRDADRTTEDVVAAASELLERLGASVAPERASAFPDEVIDEQTAQSAGASRRGFFGQTVDAAKGAAGKTVEHLISSNVGSVAPKLGEMLRVGEGGTLPQFDPVRHTHLIDALAEIGEESGAIDAAFAAREDAGSEDAEVFTRRFASIDIDMGACSACAMCTVFCPTHALRKSEDPPTESGGLLLEFSASECANCGLCADICMKSCLTLSPTVPIAQLFDFEPQLFDIPKPDLGNHRFACR